MSETLNHRIVGARNRFADRIADGGSAFNQLTQSYVQKSFTIFNLFVSTALAIADVETKAETVQIAVDRTHHELLETQLNVWHLLLLKRNDQLINLNEYARTELDFARFVGRDEALRAAVLKLLPSIRSLYFLIENRHNKFHPFATIKAYHILSLSLRPPNAFDQTADLRPMNIDELLPLMRDACSESEIDDVANAIWKFINAHLSCIRSKLGSVDGDVMRQILTHVRRIAQSEKSSELR